MTAEKKEEKAEVKEEPKASDLKQFSTDIELPSKGKFYKNGEPSVVTLRPISVQEEKLLISAKSKLAIADKLLERCIVGEPIDLKELLMSDKFYLLLNLRAISYGSDYLYRIPCGCGTVFNHTVSLPKGLTLKVASDDDKEPFDVELPISGKKLSLRFLRGTDEDLIEEYIKNLPSTKPDDGDPSYAYRLALHIDKIDGKEVSVVERLQFCETMIGKDSLVMRSEIVKHETGPELVVEATCPSCRRTLRSELPLGEEFFPASVS